MAKNQMQAKKTRRRFGRFGGSCGSDADLAAGPCRGIVRKIALAYPATLGTTAAIAILAAIAALGASNSAARPPAPSRDAWQPLFNGRNLEGWEAVGPGLWTAENGELVMRRPPSDRGGGWLVTRKNYGDFLLRFELKPGHHLYNSGVLIRDPGHAKIGRPALNGFEIKLAQGDRMENGNAAIWYVSNAPIREIPEHEWTSFEIRCQGDHITTFMNGQKMAEAHSRRSYSGGIGFHLHGGNDQPEVRWRNIEIRELPPAPHPDQLEEEKISGASGESSDLLSALAPLSNGWTLRDGVLHGTATSPGAGDSWTMAVGPYDNFLLTFDFKVSAGGIAGVGIRGGPEYRISDKDQTFPSGSVPGFARAFITEEECLQEVYHPGKWNQARFYVHGDHVITFLNLHNSAEGHSAAGRLREIGFRAAPGTTVDFRNVQIKKVR